MAERFTVPRAARCGYKARYGGFYLNNDQERASKPEGLCSVRKSVRRELKVFGAPLDEYMILNDRSDEDDALNSLSGHGRLVGMVRNVWSYVHAELGKGRGKHGWQGGLVEYDSILAARSPRIVFSLKALQARLNAGRFPTMLIDRNLPWAGACDEALLGCQELLIGEGADVVYNKATGRFHQCKRRKAPVPSLAVYKREPERDRIERLRSSSAFREAHGLPRLEPLSSADPLPVTMPFKTWYGRGYPLELSKLFGWDFVRWAGRVKRTMMARARKPGFHPAALRFNDPLGYGYGARAFHTIWRWFSHEEPDSPGHDETPAELTRAVPPKCRLSRRQVCCLLHAADDTFERCRNCRVPFGCEPDLSEPWTRHPLWRDAIPNREYLVELAAKLKRRHREWLKAKDRDPDSDAWPVYYLGQIPPTAEQLLADYESLLKYGEEGKRQLTAKPRRKSA